MSGIGDEVISGAVSKEEKPIDISPGVDNHLLKQRDLVVHGINGRLTTLNTNGISNVSELKVRLQIVTGIPILEQRLVLDKEILLPHEPVPENEISLVRVTLPRPRQPDKKRSRTASRRLSDSDWYPPSPKEPPTFLCKAYCHRGDRQVSSVGYGMTRDWCKECDEWNTIVNLRSSGFI
jgi:hypothetical protein